MKRIFSVTLVIVSVSMLTALLAAKAQAPSQQVQQQIIALDKQWGEAGGKGDTATLQKILADNMLALGPNGEAQGKQEQVNAATAAPGGSYQADEFKFEMLSPDIVVMTHRGTATTKEGGKDVTESHRSLHVFQRRGGNWQVVASAQAPIKTQ